MLAYKVFVVGGLGLTYGDLLTVFASLKKRLGFQQERIDLQSKGHPELLSKWVGQGQMKCAMPVLPKDGVSQFHDTWWGWWKSLQPGWRKPASVNHMEREMYGNVWSSLNISGSNGWLSIVATLFWWGKAVEELDTSAHGEWLEAVTDSLWMLQGLLKFVEE